jgi:hypothetical protein
MILRYKLLKYAFSQSAGINTIYVALERMRGCTVRFGTLLIINMVKVIFFRSIMVIGLHPSSAS